MSHAGGGGDPERNLLELRQCDKDTQAVVGVGGYHGW